MKKILVATALAAFGLVPIVGTACEYNDAAKSAASAPDRVSPQAASSVVAPAAVANQTAPKVVKQAQKKARAPVPDAKVAAATVR